MPRRWSSEEIAYLLYYLSYNITHECASDLLNHRAGDHNPIRSYIAVTQKATSITKANNLKNADDIRQYLVRYTQNDPSLKGILVRELEQWEKEMIEDLLVRTHLSNRLTQILTYNFRGEWGETMEIYVSRPVHQFNHSLVARNREYTLQDAVLPQS